MLDSINETRNGDKPSNWNGRLADDMGVGNPKLKGVSRSGVAYQQTGVWPT
ncbi:MAG: hypothetical protein AB8E74_09375 [Prochlorococcus sp.]